MPEQPESGQQPKRRGFSALILIAAGLVVGVYGFVTRPGHVSPLTFVLAMIAFVGIGLLVYAKQRRRS